MSFETYIDYDYYAETFGGTVDSGEITPLLPLAADIIRGRISLSDITDYQLERYRRAVCIQAEKLYEQGGLYGLRYSTEETLKSVSVGDFSATQGSSYDANYITDVSYAALAVLEECGLLYRGGDFQ